MKKKKHVNIEKALKSYKVTPPFDPFRSFSESFILLGWVKKDLPQRFPNNCLFKTH